MKKLLVGFTIALFMIFAANRATAGEKNPADTTSTTTEETKKASDFDPGALIIEHVIDSYGWHIASKDVRDEKGNVVETRHFTIPLPIILIDNGLHVFMSNKFEHGHQVHNGYALGFTEKYKGKIVKLKGDYKDYTGSLESILEKEGITKEDVEDLEELVDEEATAGIIDLSITKNVCSLFISILLILFIFLKVAKQYKKRENEAPRGLQGMMEPLILFIRDEVAIPSLGKTRYQKYLPYLLTLFFFILINNLMGLIPIFPGGANLTGNIAVTGVLALITFLITSFSADAHYWKHLVNTPGVPWFLKIPIPLMPLVEIIGIFTKPFVLMVRLFANITAGHIIALGVISLVFIFGGMSVGLGYGVSIVSIIFYVFMGLLECIVAFIQAFVFTLLTAMFTGMAMPAEHAVEHK